VKTRVVYHCMGNEKKGPRKRGIDCIKVDLKRDNIKDDPGYVYTG
jgi:hypothetical protein